MRPKSVSFRRAAPLIAILLAVLAGLSCARPDGESAGAPATRPVTRHLIRPLLERGVDGASLPVPVLHDLAIGLGFLNDVEKMSLLGGPGGWCRVERVAVPDGARLAFDVALQRPGWTLFPDGVAIEVEASGHGTVLEARIDTARNEADRSWRRISVDVSLLAGRTVDLTFRIAAGSAPASDVPTVAIGWPTLAGREPRPARAAAARRAAGPNVLVLLVDALRADRLSCYGGARPTSPEIDALARESVRYENAVSTSSWTTPAVASLFTGLAPRSHGVVSTVRSRLPLECETLAETYAAAGYDTAAFVTNPIVDRRARFDQGFESFELLPHFKAEDAIGSFLEWLDGLPPGARAPFFAYVHLMDPHAPYSAPSPFGGRFDPGYDGPLTPRFWDETRIAWQRVRERGEGEKRKFIAERMGTLRSEKEHCSREYDAEVAYMDSAVGGLARGLRDRGLLDETVFVFTADHGEEFFEHGLHGHGKNLHDETIRIPLIIRARGQGLAPAVVDAPVSLVDVGATLARLTGVRPSPSSLGRSVLPADSPPRDRVVFASIETGRFRDAPELVTMDAARTRSRKAIEILHGPTVLLLFDLASDAGESANLAATSRASDFGDLVRAIERWREETGRNTPDTALSVDDVQRAILEGLGYVR